MAPWPRGAGIITHPDAQFHIFSPVDLHPLIQQTNLLKVQPVHYEAANQGRAPGGLKDNGDQICSSAQVMLAWHRCYSNSRVKKRIVTLHSL